MLRSSCNRDRFLKDLKIEKIGEVAKIGGGDIDRKAWSRLAGAARPMSELCAATIMQASGGRSKASAAAR